VDLPFTRRVKPVRQSPRPMLFGSFTEGTYPRHRPYSLAHRLSPTTFASRLPRPTRPPLARSPGFHPACGTIRLSDDSPRLTSHFVFRLIGSLIPVPPGNAASPPGVTSRSSVPCRPHTPCCDGWVRMPSLPQCQLDLAPSLADRFILGVAPSITARYFSACPSDSTSRWTPCPPVVSRQRSNLGSTLAVSAVSGCVPV